jgi:hypothetical protein
MKTLIRFRHLIMAMLLIASLTISCKKSDSPSVTQDNGPVITNIGTPTGVVSDALIGPSGGTLHSADGNLTVTIPADALSSATTISIQPVTKEAPLGLGFGYQLLPEGISFAKPVELTFHYDEQLLQQSPEDFLWIVTQAGDGSWNAMLKSALDKNAKTVTITTTHFSVWSLGRFIDLTLNPASSTIQKGHSLQLRVTGFRGDKVKEEDDLAPLAYSKDDGIDVLTPLTPIPPPIPPYASRLVEFKIKQWTMNGVVAPVSNSHGSLNASGKGATYTAPDQTPANNPVAVSVQLEAKNKLGSSATFLVTSNITVVDYEFYLLVKIDGQEFKYFQSDSSFYTLINCFVDEDHFQIIAEVETASSYINIFTLAFSNPSVTTRILNGPTGANENLSFWPLPELEYTLNYEHRELNADSACVRKDQYGNATATLTEYTGTGSIARGSFSGTLNEDNTQLNAQCKMPIAHSIEGEFRLMVNPK